MFYQYIFDKHIRNIHTNHEATQESLSAVLLSVSRLIIISLPFQSETRKSLEAATPKQPVSLLAPITFSITLAHQGDFSPALKRLLRGNQRVSLRPYRPSAW